MAIVINGSGTVTGISVGGLPDGIVDAGTLATNSVDSAELIDGAVDTSHLASGVGGITNRQIWILTTNLSLTGNSSLADITANQAESTVTGYARLGGAMTVSSGVFTFPETGIWAVDGIYNFTGANGYAMGQILVTVNGGSNWTSVARLQEETDDQEYANGYMSSQIDVTNTSNVKVKFQQGGTASTLEATNTMLQTGFIFTRIGDT